MQLIGGFGSPYVRRVAVSLNALGMPFTSKTPSAFQEPEALRPHNPLVRVPVLVLDDGDELVDSNAILDALDEMAGPERRLMPASGKDRRHAMKLTFIGVGSMDKAVAAYYELAHRPEEKVHQPWIDRAEMQVLGGLGYLNHLAEAAGDTGWLAGGDRMTQADITAAVAFGFANRVRPKLGVPGKVPHLAKFAARCEGLDIFKASPQPG